ncbi:MAG: hypothetical protein LBT00_09820 [Spirochaetaceae bacterium]|nr:hypothetical protein [Spirochaetaceae bacterium]
MTGACSPRRGAGGRSPHDTPKGLHGRHCEGVARSNPDGGRSPWIASPGNVPPVCRPLAMTVCRGGEGGSQ